MITSSEPIFLPVHALVRQFLFHQYTEPLHVVVGKVAEERFTTLIHFAYMVSATSCQTPCMCTREPRDRGTIMGSSRR